MKNKKLLLALALIFGLLIIGLISYINLKPVQNQSAKPAPPRGINDVQYTAPTAEEKAAANGQKNSNVSRDQLNATPQASTTKASIVIVDSSQYDNSFEVRAYISNVFEDSGTCTVTFTKSDAPTVTQSGPATSSATNTQCQTIDIPVSQFSVKGTWQIIVGYSSPNATGSTTSKLVTIK
ncbi:MAG: hypothetical protein H7252_03975 [Cytophaga sp.]|nr:hypothetical protein [Undibacterium sp.]